MNATQKKVGALLLCAIVLLGIGFLSGMSYQKGKKSPTASVAANTAGPQNGGFGAGRGRTGGRLGAFGAVKAVSSTSITISNTRTSTDQTFSIDSTTTVTDGGAASTIDAIKVGDTVAVRAATSDATKAASIVLNPQVPTGGGFGAGGGAPVSPAN